MSKIQSGILIILMSLFGELYAATPRKSVQHLWLGYETKVGIKNERHLKFNESQVTAKGGVVDLQTYVLLKPILSTLAKVENSAPMELRICRAGSYIYVVESNKSNIERGCIEDERFRTINRSIDLIEKIALYSNSK